MSETFVKVADAPKCPDWCQSHSLHEGSIEHAGIVGTLPTSSDFLDKDQPFNVTAQATDYFEPPVITRTGPYLMLTQDASIYEDGEVAAEPKEPVMTFTDLAALRRFIAAATALADSLDA